jgi:phosphatidylinositol alpha-1,6-mannosyltransferase
MDAQRFTPAPPDPEVRRRLGWDGRTVILTAGRLQKRKGQDQMILALPRIRRDFPNVLYAIVGDGEERTNLESLVAREGLGEHVQFCGEVSDQDLIHCYQQCDLFVLPNRQVGQDIEGFGMVLVEAQACGKPVVAGASGGTAETMRVPETGRIVCCEGPDLLAEVVVSLLTDLDLRTRMGEAARVWAVENFDWATLSRQAASLFQRGKGGAEAASPAEAVHV